ncbi:cryptochrome/photolyase family protein [Aliikangiella coralliicola]|uniref:Deoxyribodipyrimidine photo-lyase n=1 Tax=Aliikangiella coralliicola TaxID=2592383 RepID=A0A545U644_9GAMM|nr:deoxyribodipyrimidine photo-lyase [Aliikangiella coralliicola]TQV84942.1 deoxyribodipyrimidine photo-lyase [Aliikangiella coralliicola]
MNLIWFRNDLRVDDNPALHHAVNDKAQQTVAVYLLCQTQWELHNVGNNQRALIACALENLKEKLNGLNIPLLVVDADTFSQVPDILSAICHQFNIQNLYFNVEYPLNERLRDRRVVDVLAGKVKCHRFVADSLVAPWEIVTGERQGYKVYSAFARAVYRNIDQQPVVTYSPPDKLPKENLSLVDFSKVSSATSGEPIKVTPTAKRVPDVAEQKMHKKLRVFCKNTIDQYESDRDFPAIEGTSDLSAALAVGTISVRRCYQVAKDVAGEKAHKWIGELIWRDFYRSVIWHFPDICKGRAFNPVDSQLTWSRSIQNELAWQKGETGIPIIDAAMQQLIQTGWMHNRLRMIVASYFTKNLWLDWRKGEAFFAQHLFDYDFASNNGGWQWCASVGTDAAPYFRIFNPQAQQKKFDVDAFFIKQWVPALKSIDAKTIHRFESQEISGYFKPQVDLKLSRKLAIENFKKAKTAT